MVFGFGKKKETKEIVQPIHTQKHIPLSDVNNVLKEHEDKILQVLLDKTGTIRDRIDSERKNIIQIISDFEKDDLKKEDVDKHLKILIERGKSSVVSGIKKETSIDLSKIQSYSDVVDLNHEAGQLLKRAGDILGINSRILHIFAKKYAEKLKDVLAKISADKATLQKIVDNHSRFETARTEILDNIESIRNLKKQIESKNKNLIQIRNDIEVKTKTIQSLGQEIETLKSTNEYHEFLRIKDEIDSLKPEKERIKNEIDAQFSKISRPLGKYSYISSLDKPLKKIMEAMIENPLEAITNENKNPIIEILQSVVKGVVTGSVSVKDSDKAVEQINETINRLDEFLKMKQVLSQKIELLEKRQDVFDIKNLNEKETKLVKTRDDKVLDEFKITQLKKEIEQDTKMIPQVVFNVENKLNSITAMNFKIQD